MSKSDRITLKSGAVVEKRGNEYFWQGDIRLSKEQFKSLDANGTIYPIERPDMVTPEDIRKDAIRFKSVGVYPTPYNLWAMVRYTLNPNLDFYTRGMIADAIAH